MFHPRLRPWLPVLLWMTLIFVGSTDLLAENRTSRLIGPLLRWLKPDLSDTAIRRVQLVVRKTGHLAEYAVLALLLGRALRQSGWPTPNPAGLAGITLAGCALYAVSDELHQHFVASRQASVWDVAFDSLGAGLGLGGRLIYARLRSARPSERSVAAK